MYRTFTSAMRISGIAAMLMFLVGSATGAGTNEQGSGSAMTSSQMNNQHQSQTMSSQQSSSTKMSSSATSASMSAPHPRYERLDRLVGRSVYGSAGEKLGKIEDLVLSGQDNSISYAVLSYGGFFGFGDKLFAVPWSEFQRQPGKETYTIDVRKQYLKNAPGFAKDHWPNMADQNWAQDIARFYRQGRQASASMSAGQSQQSSHAQAQQLPTKYRRVTRLIGLPARDFQGERLGELEDIVMDRSNDNVTYGVVLLDTTPWALERKEAIVPWSTIQVMPELEALKLGTDEKTLEAVAFSRHEFPDLTNPQYARSIESRYQSTTPYWETLGFVPGEGPKGQETRMSRMPTKEMNVSVWQAGSKYNQRFDPGLVTTVRGKIQSIGVFDISRDAVRGLRLTVKMANGDSRTIYAGPRPYIEDQGVTLHYGDDVTITGAPTSFGWRGQVLMAATIQTQGQTLRLRSANGAPEWSKSVLLKGSSSSSSNQQQ